MTNEITVINETPNNTFEELVVDAQTGEIVAEGHGDLCDLKEQDEGR